MARTSVSTIADNLKALFAGSNASDDSKLMPLSYTLEIPLAANADSATTLAPAVAAAVAVPVASEIVSGYVVHATTLTGHTQNYVTFEVARYANDGTVSTNPLALALSAATVTVSAYDGKAMTLTNSLRNCDAGDVLVGWADKTGTGISAGASKITLLMRAK
jgi:hypothetical protein